jgi:hypothetical protein
MHTRDDSGIRLDSQGRWWHDGELVEHPRIVEAFNCGIFPDDDGRFRLQLGNDWCYVDVEDAAYRVLAIDLASDDRLSIRLSDRTAEILDTGSLQVDADGALRCTVKSGKAKAKFSREAHYALGSHLEEDGGLLSLKVGAKSHPLPLIAK